MSLSPLLMGPQLEADIRRVREHAERPENWYRPAEGHAPPGENPAYVVVSLAYRAVFSITVMPDGLIFRHVSVSTVRPGFQPNPTIAFTFCHLFGLTGAKLHAESGTVLEPGPWDVDIDEPHITFLQEYQAAGSVALPERAEQSP